MEVQAMATGISLNTFSNCPHCGRPLLGLAYDKCSFCHLSLEACFQSLPELASRLERVCQGWTPESFVAWAQPRPGQLLWALGTGHWKCLGYWVTEDHWRTWACHCPYCGCPPIPVPGNQGTYRSPFEASAFGFD